VSNKTTIEQHFENLQKELLQEAPWVSGISATLLTAFHYLTMESNKKDV
jgi:predicted ATP-grasp superfamily ATP-dependent carboligase